MKKNDIELKEELQRKRSFNGLTAKEWARMSMSVIDGMSSTRGEIHKEHGATFPQKLAENFISMYSKAGDVVFDPFAGTGTTLFASESLSRESIGIELQSKFFKYIKNNCKPETTQIINGDCIKKIDTITKEVDLTFTSPPYADLLVKVSKEKAKRGEGSLIVSENNSHSKVYSKKKTDFGNMSVEKYTKSVDVLMEKIYKITKKGGYNIWVVKDFRDTKNKIPYVDLHTIIAQSGVRAGFKYQDLIIWDQSKQRRNVLLGYPSVMYVNQNHSFIVVLRKW